MNLSIEEGVQLVKGITQYLQAEKPTHIEAVVAPPAVHLAPIASQLKNSKLSLAAQNVSEQEQGAFTGEVSVAMLKEVGCELVIIGHSERRQLYGETDQLINKKLQRVIAAGLIPILCVGETLEVRQEGRHIQLVKDQLHQALAGFSENQLSNLVIAYEPVWAIGTGETASPEQAQEMHAVLRKELANLFSASLAEEISLLYGGSVKPENARALFGQPDVDGGLIGGASLKLDSFLELLSIGEAVLR